MFTPICVLEGKSIPDVKEDFRNSQRVEQYRVSSNALYLPEGLRWKYIPLKEIKKAENSFRVISAGHCVPVREKRPELDITTESGTIHLRLEKRENMNKIMEALRSASIEICAE